ncbi:MAG: hypothetical protein Q4F18_12970 [Clostridia bacterium]|nr:hypothetical protein [Clostridia bacterium]
MGTMNIQIICTDRKAMAHALAAHLGTTAEYLRTPTYAFRVGNLQVERDGSITGEREDFEAAADWLLENGYIQEPLFAAEAPAEEPATEPATNEDVKAPTEQEITHTCVSLPLAEFTHTGLINLMRMLYARQRLICEMTQSDGLVVEHELIATLQSPDIDNMEILERVLCESIDNGFTKGITLVDGRLGIDFPFDPEQPTRWRHYADLLLAIADKAKAATRVNATLIEPADSEMKYFCRGFLLQLGMGGAAHKETRSVLLNHLHGFAAFRTTEKMDAHKQKYAELRRQLREQDSEAHSEVIENEKA